MNEISENILNEELDKLSLVKIQIGEDYTWRVQHGDPEFEAKKFRIYMGGVTAWAWISKTTITGNQLEQAQRERKHSCSELEMKDHLHQESYARSCREIEESKRRCFQEENTEKTTKIERISYAA